MSDIRLALVNGTGPPGPAYDEIMRQSFCSQLGRQLGAKSFYLRGPDLFGWEVRNEARTVHQWLRAAYAADPTVRLMLAGYSRGGSAAIMACEMLEHDGIAVDSLFLFDAVGRHAFPGGSIIPANVTFSRHARRSLAAEFVEKYDACLNHIGLIGALDNPIRPLFGNVGLVARGKGDHAPPQAFLGSHGAVGGVGWRSVREDLDCEREVAEWMSEQLRSRGVEVSLSAFEPKSAPVETHPSHLAKWLTHNIRQFVVEHDEPHHQADGVSPPVG